MTERTWLTCKKKKGHPQRHPDVCLAIPCNSLRPVVTESGGRSFTKYFCAFKTRAEKLAQMKEMREAKADRCDRMVEFIKKESL